MNEIDYSELSGFQVGRAAALSEWVSKKEKREFKLLCLRLYRRNYARKLRKNNPEKVRTKLRAWRRKTRTLRLERERDQRAARRKPITLTCQNPDCGQSFSTRRYRHAKWCSKACSNAVNGPKRKSRNRGIRNRKLSTTLMAILTEESGLTLAEIAALASGAKRNSIATKLSSWRKDGVVVLENGRYRLASATTAL